MNRGLLQLEYGAACLATDVTKPHTDSSNIFCLSRVLNRINLELMYQTAPQHATHHEAGTVGRKKKPSLFNDTLLFQLSLPMTT